MNIVESGKALRAGKVSSAELTQTCLAKIEAENPRLNAFLTVTSELALQQAAAADADFARGIDRGPLQGIPYALKDNFATKGIRTTCGSKLFENHVPDFDSAVTETLAAVGAVLLGKTGLHELAYGITSNNPHFGAVRNPCDPERIPGGSSGGSAAAVAAGMAAMAMGTDTGGSIRIPAAFCGTIGIKPTSGRVSRFGCMPLDFSLDHMGPMTLTVRDAALTLEALAGYDSRDDTSSRNVPGRYLPPDQPSIAGWRIGRPENFFNERIQPEVRAAYEEVLARAERLGAQIVPVRMPDIAAINVVGRMILMSEASALLERHMDRRESFGADVLALLDQGRLLAATDYVNAQRLRRLMQKDFARIWTDIDVLLTPTSAIVAPKIGQTTVEIDGVPEDTRMAATRFVRPFNVLGIPALSLPCGAGEAGMPLGLQIVGKAFDEAKLFEAGACLTESRASASLNGPAGHRNP
jgi:aspartyl-tRNA(Asn)/glutamyl-tRNA(Gln) amidotransferase subunit A